MTLKLSPSRIQEDAHPRIKHGNTTLSPDAQSTGITFAYYG